MKQRRNQAMARRASLLGGVFIVLLGAGCSGSTDGTEPDRAGGPVLVFAAASLSDAFTTLATTFEAKNPTIDIELNFAGSSALREQILEGAPADVFAAANEANMTAITDAGLATTPVVFANNELQIAVPAGNPGQVATLADFERTDLLIGLCAVEVPCGDFARKALDRAGVVPAIDTNEPDVRSLTTKVAAGELDAGIVYLTDVLAAGSAVEGIAIPPADNQIANYPIVALRDAPNAAGAQAFVAFVLSAEGQSLLATYGFTPAG